MAVTLRFRPVLFGPLAKPTTVFYVAEGPGGQVFFREFEFARPLAVALDMVTVEDLPDPYRSSGAAASILPVQEVTAETAAEAHKRMTDVLGALRLQGAPRTSQEQGTPPRRRRMDRESRWPTFEETMENVEKGIIDDRTIAVPPYDLEPWEILGLPEPGEAPERPESAEPAPAKKARKH
ncbi:MAG: hypothetical protein HY690_13445 [Chloroflexi bacterium]|nr:hypothetical protein [Chloroflexota bacterium]